MKKNIKIIIGILLCLIILFFVIILLINNGSNDKKYINEENSSANKNENLDTFKPINNINNYFIAKNILNRYIEKTKHLNGDSFINDKKIKISKEEYIDNEKKEAIKFFETVIDNEYKNYYNLSEEKIINEATKYVKNGDYSKSDIIYNIDISEIYEYKYTDNITLFLLYANVNDKDLNLLIKYDTQKNIYSLFLSNYIEDNNYDINMNTDRIKINCDDIIDNMYSKIKIGTITDEDMSKEYFNIQKNNLMYNLKLEYNKLNNEYKQKKYNDYQSFEEYYSSIKDEIKDSKLAKYSVEKIDDKKIYTLIDNYKNIYIIESVNSIANYSVILDNYTIDTAKFIKTYNDSSIQEKVILNIERVFTALNNKDYKYAYSKLADSFKNNYFKNEEEFKKFVEEYLYSKNKIEYEEFNREGTLNTYKIRVIKEFEEGEEIPEGKNAPSTYLNIVMQLNEGTDFEISFRIV